MKEALLITSKKLNKIVVKKPLQCVANNSLTQNELDYAKLYLSEKSHGVIVTSVNGDRINFFVMTSQKIKQRSSKNLIELKQSDGDTSCVVLYNASLEDFLKLIDEAEPRVDSKITFKSKNDAWEAIKNRKIKELEELDVFYWDDKLYSICNKGNLKDKISNVKAYSKEQNLVNFEVKFKEGDVNFHHPQIYIKTEFQKFVDLQLTESLLRVTSNKLDFLMSLCEILESKKLVLPDLINEYITEELHNVSETNPKFYWESEEFTKTKDLEEGIKISWKSNFKIEDMFNDNSGLELIDNKPELE